MDKQKEHELEVGKIKDMIQDDNRPESKDGEDIYENIHKVSK